MEKPIVSVERLSHRYSIQWAVRDVSFDIPQKGIYGLLGSNGAGKSTVMNIMCGVIKQTEGRVLINGMDTRLDPIGTKRHIGFLPQKPPLYADLTVEEYLRHAADIRWVPENEIKKAVEESYGFVCYFTFSQTIDKEFIRRVSTTFRDSSGNNS